MAYFNYHARITQKIKNGELEYYYFEPNYKNIGFAMVLCFANKKYPVRENRFGEYFDLIGSFYVTTKVDNIYKTESIFDKKHK